MPTLRFVLVLAALANLSMPAGATTLHAPDVEASAAPAAIPSAVTNPVAYARDTDRIESPRAGEPVGRDSVIAAIAIALGTDSSGARRIVAEIRNVIINAFNFFNVVLLLKPSNKELTQLKRRIIRECFVDENAIVETWSLNATEPVPHLVGDYVDRLASEKLRAYRAAYIMLRPTLGIGKAVQYPGYTEIAAEFIQEFRSDNDRYTDVTVKRATMRIRYYNDGTVKARIAYISASKPEELVD